jgi:hypothetical protein
MPATFSVLEIHFSPFLLATFSRKYLQKTCIREGGFEVGDYFCDCGLFVEAGD